jgi:hypothetical protein
MRAFIAAHFAQTGCVTGCPTKVATPASANRNRQRRVLSLAIEPYPRQHVEDDADRQDELCCDPEPTKTCTVSTKASQVRSNVGTALPAGMKRKSSAGSPGMPRNKDAPPIMRINKLGIMVESKSA